MAGGEPIAAVVTCRNGVRLGFEIHRTAQQVTNLQDRKRPRVDGLRAAGGSWLVRRLVREVESLRSDVGLSSAFAEIEAACHISPAAYDDGTDFSKFTQGFDIVVVDWAEHLADRVRLAAISSRTIPLRSLSVYVLTDSPEEAFDEAAIFESRIRDNVFAFASKVCVAPPEIATPLVTASPEGYLGWLLKRRLDEALQEINRRLASCSAPDDSDLKEVEATIRAERRWIRDRLGTLRADIRAALLGRDALQHVHAIITGAQEAIAERYGVDSKLLEPRGYIVATPVASPASRFLLVTRDIVLTVKTMGVWLLGRAGASLADQGRRDPRERALAALLDRDVMVACRKLMYAIDRRLPALASARVAERSPEYRHLVQLRALTGRALALRNRIQASTGRGSTVMQ